MRVFAVWIELPHDMTVQCVHDADPRKHGRAVMFDDQKHRFDRSLPLRAVSTWADWVFSLWNTPNQTQLLVDSRY
jgi:hypothetical protein